MRTWCLVTCLAVALVATSCSTGSSTTAAGAPGLRVVLPADTTATVRSRSISDVFASRGATPGLSVSAAWQVKDGKLPKPARLTFDLPADASPKNSAVLTRETPDDPWTVVKTTPTRGVLNSWPPRRGLRLGADREGEPAGDTDESHDRCWPRATRAGEASSSATAPPPNAVGCFVPASRSVHLSRD